jgi:hypothetical protein
MKRFSPKAVLAVVACSCATQALAQDNACEMARQTVAADHDAYLRVFNEGKERLAGHATKEEVCEPALVQNMDKNIAALKKEMDDASALKLACPGVDRAQSGADKLIAQLQPDLASAERARDSIDKACSPN